ncbi:MAG: hypothetical protein ABFR19_03225 [Pseudomonadota bacterium]
MATNTAMTIRMRYQSAEASKLWHYQKHRASIKKIVSGGQTVLSWRLSMLHGIEAGGWCPEERTAEEVYNIIH